MQARKREVASFTDAWIETILSKMTKKVLMSHLLQMRGLKHLSSVSDRIDKGSHLLQMRGLKQISIRKNTSIIKSHLLQMRGLKQAPKACYCCSKSRIFYRCVD